MNKYLFFRTDRVGDFIVSSIILKSIKNNDPQNKIYVVCSDKNYEYIKKSDLVDGVFIFKRYDFINKIKLLFNLNKLNVDNLIVVDGKTRSILLSLFIKSRNKLFIITKKILKILSFLKLGKVIYDDEIQHNKIDIIKKTIFCLGWSYNDNDTKIFDLNKIKELSKYSKKQFLNNFNYNIFHFDEKWSYNDYIKTYKNIEPSFEQLSNFISDLIKKTNKNLIITTGFKEIKLISDLKDTFIKIDENIFKKDYNEKSAYLLTNLNFFDLQFLISNCNIIITCHGSPSHVASIFDKKIFDIIDKSEINLFRKYTYHLNNYNEFLRKDFISNSKDILNLIR